MIIIITIINAIIFIVNFSFLFYRNKNFTIIKTLNEEIKEKQTQLKNFQNQIKISQSSIENFNSQLNYLHDEQNRLNKELKEKENNIQKYYQVLENQASQSFQHYENTLDQCYKEKQEYFNSKIEEIKKQQAKAELELKQIQIMRDSATAARLREQETQQKRRFYQLQIPKKHLEDIKKLQHWKKELNDPSIVSKVIWSSYVIKPTSDLCNRIVGSSAVCGIYKITNILTQDIYIGQSVNITDRWKQHIKSGLGIDASPTNKLYNNMQQYGIQNFSFEILQKCTRNKLNEKEHFWIDFYKSNQIGLNTQGGKK